MSTTAERVGATEGGSGGGSEVVRVTVPPHSLASELRAIRIVWRRDLIRFANDRIRIAASLIQPLLFLFVMGSGLQRLSSAGTHGVNLKTFIYPGILCIAVMFTAMFSAASIVWDPAVPGSCRAGVGEAMVLRDADVEAADHRLEACVAGQRTDQLRPLLADPLVLVARCRVHVQHSLPHLVAAVLPQAPTPLDQRLDLDGNRPQYERAHSFRIPPPARSAGCSR